MRRINLRYVLCSTGCVRGFTVIELMLVTVLVALLALAGFQSVTRSKITVEEQVALNSLRLLAKSCHFFHNTHKQYPDSLADLGPPTSSPAFVEPALYTGTPPVKQGYVFVYTKVGDTGFTLLANPQIHGTTGARHFYTDQILIIYSTEQDRNATSGDTVIP